MDSASFTFIFFGLAVAVVINLNRSRVWRSMVLSAASLYFLYALEKNPLAYVPLLGFLALGYLCILCHRRGWLRVPAVAIVGVLVAYIWLKKYTFFPEAILLHSVYFTLGLSYIFFRVMHLVIESGDGGEIASRIGVFEYLLYTLNFTTFISGPIQRYEEFAQDQFAATPIPLDAATVGLQLERLVRGFFKVNVLAMLFDILRQDALLELTHPASAHEKLQSGLILMAVYPLFLYCNFSGYIDVVIALARLMRLRLPENFDRPFSATSFIDFWSRWHITLSTWFKNYVYNPLILRLMRRVESASVQPYLAVLAFFVTFFLVGLWHGRTSEFLFYGLLQGGGVSANKLWQVVMAQTLGRKRYKALAGHLLYRTLARGLTFCWFAFTLLWFWSGWAQIHAIFGALRGVEWSGIWLVIWVAASIVLAAWEGLRAALLSLAIGGEPILTTRYARVVYASALGTAAVFITVLLNSPAPGIVYKAF